MTDDASPKRFFLMSEGAIHAIVHPMNATKAERKELVTAMKQDVRCATCCYYIPGSMMTQYGLIDDCMIGPLANDQQSACQGPDFACIQWRPRYE